MNYVKESLQNNRIVRWNKKQVLVYVSEITYPEYKSFQKEYNNLIKKALTTWNKVTQGKVKFILTQEQFGADIIVKFTRVTRQAWGMCCYDNIVNSEFKNLTISLGLPNQYSGAKPTKNDIFVVILHEFGHALGLDHNKKESIMHAGYYPTSHYIFLLDFITVNIIYDLPTGSYYNDIEKEIRKLEEKYQPRQKENLKTQNIERKNIQESLCEIGNLNLYKMTLQNNIQVPNKYKELMKNEQIKKYNTF